MTSMPVRKLFKNALRCGPRSAGFLRSTARPQSTRLAMQTSVRSLSVLSVATSRASSWSSSVPLPTTAGFPHAGLASAAAAPPPTTEPRIVLGDKVSLHMTGRLSDGTSFGSTEADRPIEFVVGAGEVLLGMEEGVIGLAKGVKKTIIIPPEKAFGKENQLVKIPREQLGFHPEQDAKLAVGKALQLKNGDEARVVELDKDTIVLDLAHEFAGKTLHVDVTIVDRIPADKLNKFEQLVVPEIITPGDNTTYPQRGDKLSMHYTGKLASNGKIFDSSVQRGQPFEFQIGVGQVIRGWDEGVMRMSKGEKSILHINAEKGYDKDGAGEVIPPDADLEFEVELLDIIRPSAPAPA